MINPKNKTIGCRCSEIIILKVEEIANELQISNGEVLRRALLCYINQLNKKEKEAQEQGGD